MEDLPRPILLNVGRVAPEKNIEAFLELDVEGSKVVVGGGPALDRMRAAYPEVLFLGPKHGAELASTYTAADVFVFPSRTDTFGLVNIEALACGLPVAAFPVPGPLDIVGEDGRGIHGATRYRRRGWTGDSRRSGAHWRGRRKSRGCGCEGADRGPPRVRQGGGPL